MNTRHPPEFDISAWLKAIGLEQYAAAFAENQLTLGTLPELTDADLKECGVVSVGHRKQILAAIRELTAKMPSPATPGAVSEAMANTPKTLGHFELLEPIGRGGIGRVFRAWDSTLERQVALKLLDRSLAANDPQFVQDFIREAKSAAGVSHPHIVQIYFAGEDKGEYYIAMELFEGQSMAERIERGPMDEKSVLRIARQIVEALAATNARRLIHGDIKPHNIFITANGDAKLLDFGLARKGNAGPNADGSVTGSAYYISPERARAQAEDFRSDIYSLGATLFEALTGLPPFEAESVADLVTKRLEADAPRLRSVKPNASPALDLLIARMLAREASDRPPSYDELLSDLVAAENAPLAGLAAPKQAPPVAPVPRPAAAPAKPSAENVAAVPVLVDPSPPKRTLRRMLGDKRFLAISIAAHVLFIAVAAFLVVQTITAKRKLTFTSAPPSPNPSQRALEHQVHMAKKQNTMSAPAQPKRITTTGLAKVALPEMPAMPTSDLTPSKMAGMGGAGFGLGAAGSAGGKGGGGGPVPFFGLRNSGAGLAGTFYDLKQDRDGKPSDMAPRPGEKDGWAGINEPTNKIYDEAVLKLIRNSMNESSMAKYFRGAAPLYTTQIFMPSMDAKSGPGAFNLADKVQPRRWIVVYSGKVTPSESGSYRFVGWADDILVVRFDNRVVLDGCLTNLTNRSRKKTYPLDPFQHPLETPVGETFEVRSGISYDMEIVIGERPGGQFSAFLLLEKDGVASEKNSAGGPKLPIFKLAASPMPAHAPGLPSVAPDTSWSVWKAQPRQALFGR